MRHILEMQTSEVFCIWRQSYIPFANKTFFFKKNLHLNTVKNLKTTASKNFVRPKLSSVPSVVPRYCNTFVKEENTM